MKKILTLWLLLLTLNLHSQNQIVAAEYFFGDDPGFGNAAVLATVPSEFLNTTFNIPTDDLGTGMNVLYIRVKNSQNRWSLAGKKMIYTLPPANFNIVSAEYYFNEDPGLGSATPITIANGSSVSQMLSIPIPLNLEPGVHKLFLRVKREDGKWSLNGSKLFYIFPPNLETEIVAAEYFFDLDPGFGEGEVLSIPNASSIDVPIEIPVPEGLIVGDHVLCVRVKNSNEKWSLLGCKNIEVQEPNGINENDDLIQIFPNPTSSMLYFKTENAVVKSAMVISMKGELLLQLSHPKNIELNNLSSGNYLIQLALSSGKSISKIVTKQ